MQVRFLSALLLLSSSLLFSTVVCDPNHHHNHHNDFPWQNILSSLGIVLENQTSEATVGPKEHYTSESTLELMNSEIPVVVQNGTTIEISQSNSSSRGIGMGYKVGIPIVSILFFICFWYCICKCCCRCCEKETPGVVIMQSNTVQNQQPPPVAPQIILQQPIIHQQAPPMYDVNQRWAHPPPQGSQWGQPPQGPPQWAPYPMDQQQQYSPNTGYDNPGYTPATAPPPYNTGKY